MRKPVFIKKCGQALQPLLSFGEAKVSFATFFSGLRPPKVAMATEGGEWGIRTLGTLSGTHAFQACSLSHSDNSPKKSGRKDK